MNHRKGYRSAQEAMRSKAFLANPGAEIDQDCPCGLVHVNLPKASSSPGPFRSRRDDIPRAVRDLVMIRDGGCCIRCGISVTGLAYSVHHRKLRSQGGKHDPQTLITLCGGGITGCHGYVHGHVAESQAAGWLVLSTEDPALVSVLIISPHGPGASAWLTPGGEYSYEDPAERAA